MNPTLIAMFSVLAWGMSLPIIHIFERSLGIPAYTGLLYLLVGTFGVINHFARRRPLPDKAIFRNPFFYGRWLSFCLHEGLLAITLGLVQSQHVPFIILLNYLWPTAIIVCSILLAGVKITRWPFFIFGTLVVLAALTIEIMGTSGVTGELFANPMDCVAYVMVFFGAVSWGLYAAFTRRSGEATGGGTVTPIFQLTMALFLPFAFMNGAPFLTHFTGWLPLLLGFYAFIQFFAYQCWDVGVRKGNVVILSLFADFIPWLSLLTAHFMLGLDIGIKTVLSAVLLVSGAMIARYGTLQKKLKLETYEVTDA